MITLDAAPRDIELLHMEPATGAAGVDWRSFWGSLTFALGS